MSVATITEPALFTVEDFFLMVQDGQKADLIDGVIYMASPDTPRNDEIGMFVAALMAMYASARDLGRVFGSRVSFVLSEQRAPEPDAAFLAKSRLHVVEKTRVIGGPDIAVEIVSRDSRTRDYVEKRRLYEEAGVQEYWLIDPLQRRAEFYRLREGQYSLTAFEHNRIFRSEALAGFWLDVEWLFAEPAPNVYECLQQILAGEPAV